MQSIREHNLLILGDHNVGKNTLKEYITNKYPKLYNEIYINYYESLKNISKVIIMFNVEYKSMASKSIKSLIDTISTLNAPIIICGNKTDLINDNNSCRNEELVEFLEFLEFLKFLNKYKETKYIEISMRGNNLENLISMISIIGS